MKRMTAITIRPGAVTAAPRPIPPWVKASTTGAPAPARTSRKVPSSSEKSRRSSREGSAKSLAHSGPGSPPGAGRGPGGPDAASSGPGSRGGTRGVMRPYCPSRSMVPASRSRAWSVEPSSRSEEHTSELQSRQYLVCRLLLEKKEHVALLQRQRVGHDMDGRSEHRSDGLVIREGELLFFFKGAGTHEVLLSSPAPPFW